MRVQVMLRVPGQEWHSVIVEPATTTQVSIPSPYLISSGQGITVDVSAALTTWERDETRPVAEIFSDIVEHGREHPDHGYNCACLDQYLRELKRAVHTVAGDDVDARARLRYALRVVGQSL